MDDRTYDLYRQHAFHLEAFSNSRLAVWATRQHIQHRGYSEQDFAAMLAEHERRQFDTSPMVHLTQNQLDAMMSNGLSTVPPELRG